MLNISEQLSDWTHLAINPCLRLAISVSISSRPNQYRHSAITSIGVVRKTFMRTLFKVNSNDLSWVLFTGHTSNAYCKHCIPLNLVIQLDHSIRPHRLHAVLRCGLLLQMSHVAHGWAVQKTAEPIDMPFAGLTHVDSRNHVLDAGPDHSTGRGSFDGRHVPAHYNVSLIAWAATATARRPLHLRVRSIIWTLIFVIVLIPIRGAASSARSSFLVESDSCRLSWWDMPTVQLYLLLMMENSIKLI